MASENKSTDHTDEHHGTKRPAEIENVHSANAWEAADLGDDGRKSKFLRLMGASTKKEHHGRFIIGDKTSTSHVRSEEETEKVNSELEDQYRQGLELKISGGSRRHIGLGFHDQGSNSDRHNTVSDAAVSPSNTQTTPDTPETAPTASEKNVASVIEEQKEPSEKSVSGDDSKATSKTLTSRFVRASSS